MFRSKDYILTIFREGSFSRAAQRLYVSQPSLSASVKRIEEKIGVPIFDRATSPISLTEIGREYVRCALEIEQKELDFTRYVADRTDLLAGEIKIGGSSLFSAVLLPRMIAEFNQHYPRISFSLMEENTKNLLHELNAGNLDLMIDNVVISDDSIISTIYTAERVLLAVPDHYPINTGLRNFALTADDVRANLHDDPRRAVPLEVFRDQPFILLKAENDTGRRAEQLFKKHGLTPNVRFRLDQQLTAYNVACSGMGISFVSDTLVKYVDIAPGLCYYALPDEESARNLYFYQKNNRYLSHACRKFVAHNIGKSAAQNDG